MTRTRNASIRRMGVIPVLFVALVVATNQVEGQTRDGSRGMGKGPRGSDATFVRDRDTFHFLLEHHKDVKRTVKKLDRGVETVTESAKPEVAKKIQEHVPAMYERLKSGNGVRYWDPLFADAFRHGKKVKLEITTTTKGVKVVETSDDPAVVKVIQSHADVVSKFVSHGFEEARRSHPAPGTESKK